MTGRERVLRAIERKQPDRPPFYIEFTPVVYEQFAKRAGGRDLEEYFDVDIRQVEYLPTRHQNDYSQYLSELPEHAEVNEWGIGQLTGSGYSHFFKMVHPLQEATTVREIVSYPFPDVCADYRYAGLKEDIKELQERGYAVRLLPPFYDGTIFETAWGLRGMEELLLDMAANTKIAAVLLDRVTEIAREHARQAASLGPDVFVTGDDVGTQRAMLMAPEMWRKWLKPRLASVIDELKSRNSRVSVFYHSCGYIYPIIQDLVEIGVDILNPVQPESMDIARVAEEFGDVLAFWGGIGTQRLLPFGSPTEVKAEVNNICQTLGKQGGLIVSPTHVVEPEVPWENVVALREAVAEHRYNQG